MRKLSANSDLYEKIDSVRISESERQAAKESLRRADAFIDAIVWTGNMLRKLAAELKARSSLRDKITAA